MGLHCYVEILSGFVNALFLLVISCSVFVNALARIHQPPHIHTDRLMVVSVGGLIVNLVGVVALGHAHSHGGKPCGGGGGGGGGGNTHAHSHGGRNASHHGHSHDSHAGHVHSHSHSSSSDANLRGVYLHVLADTLGSVGVIFSSYLVSTYGWNVADPICSVFIACAIFYSSLPLLTDTVSLLTLRAPTDSQVGNPEQIVKKVLGLDGVLAVYNPFVWSHARDTVCASICVQVESTVPQQLILVRVSVPYLSIPVEFETISVS
ncbi:unnamed protein product [Calicophoron daubneyi]|uniref:Proton-coupled zinc antiporter SLC30A5 n=1 Tax=Calicophoron daubneyi TaxID=300641 RepID=A0AAV2TVD7_CALDB